MVAMSIPGTQTYDAPREHRSYRLDARLISVIEDIAMGVEAGEAGLKSCAMGAASAAALGASAAEVNAAHHRELAIIDDEDECFDAIGDLLAKGFSYEEVAKQVTLGGGATHLLAVERWCDRVQLGCSPDIEPVPWEGSPLHERRRRGHRTMTALRQTESGTTHAAVLHIVYGWRDPFVDTLPAEIIVAFGPEYVRLARYTDAVEAKRQKMVKAEALKAARPYVLSRDRTNAGSLRAALAHADESAEVFRLAAKHGHAHAGSITQEEAIKLFDLERHRSVLAWADRCLTSGDALRAAVAPPRARSGDETKEDYREQVYLPAVAARDTFLTTVKLEANRMLTSASEAFRDAWLSS